jgi:hypothetical protein
MKKLITLTALALALSYAAFVGAQHGEHAHTAEGHKEHEQTQEQKQVKENVTLIGQVIDPVCYIRHDAKGPDHKQCALYCAKQGITLGVLEDKTGKIYLAFPEGHGNPNEKLLDFVEEHVKVTGTVYHRGGLTGIVVDKIEKVSTE